MSPTSFVCSVRDDRVHCRWLEKGAASPPERCVTHDDRFIQNHSVPNWRRGNPARLAARPNDPPPQTTAKPAVVHRAVQQLGVVSRVGGSVIHLLQFTAYHPNEHGVDQPVIGTVAVAGGVYNWQQNAKTLQQEKDRMADVTATGGVTLKATATVQTNRSTHAGIHLSYPGGQPVSHVLVRVWHAGPADPDDYELQVKYADDDIMHTYPFVGHATNEGLYGWEMKQFFRFNIGT